jgi:hypothetical protein
MRSQTETEITIVSDPEAVRPRSPTRGIYVNESKDNATILFVTPAAPTEASPSDRWRRRRRGDGERDGAGERGGYQRHGRAGRDDQGGVDP